MTAVTNADAAQPGIHAPGAVRPGQAAALRAARLRMSMTQEILAGAADVSVRTVIRAEKGDEISAENLRSLCAALGLDASRLPRPEPIDGVPEPIPGSAAPSATAPWMRTAAICAAALAGGLLLLLGALNLATGYAVSQYSRDPHRDELSMILGTSLARETDGLLTRLSNGPLTGPVEPVAGHERARWSCTLEKPWAWLLGRPGGCWLINDMRIDLRASGPDAIGLAIGPGVDAAFLEAFAMQLRDEPGTTLRIAFSSDLGRPPPGSFWFDPRGADPTRLPAISPERTYMHVALSRDDKGTGR